MKSAKKRGTSRIVLRSVVCLLGLAAALGAFAGPVSAQTYLYNELAVRAGNGVQAIIGGDFNGDGILDLAVANANDGTISILLGTAGGQFAPQKTYFISSYPNGPNTLVAADFNGDGKLDLAVGSLQYGLPGQVSVLIGNGDGTFRNPVVYVAGGESTGIVAADFNGDQKVDLAVANFTDNTVSILLGNGDGTFRIQAPIAVGANPTALAGGDFNGDGKPDLITSNSGDGTVSVLLSNGDGTFQRVDSSTGANSFPGPLAVGDFNGDGRLDVVTITNYYNLTLLLGLGDGSFQSPVNIATTNLPPIALVVGDFNHDGKLDLVAGANYAIYAFLGNGDGTFQPEIISVAPALSVSFAADFNGDGQLDLATVAGICVDIVLGNGNGTFGSQTVSSLPPATYTGPLVAADFNGDGKLDVAAAENSPSQVSVLLGKGDGTFQPAMTFSLGSQGASAIVEGDFNGDGKADVAILTESNSIAVLLGNGDGTLQPPINTVLASGLYLLNLTAGDLDGDGKTDLVVIDNDVNSNDFATVLLSNGNGTFRTGTSYGVGSFGTGSGVILADLNQDGKIDLAATESFQGEVAILLGNGDGTFQNPSLIPVRSGPGTSTETANLTWP